MIKLKSFRRVLCVDLYNVLTSSNFWISVLLLYGVLLSEVIEGAYYKLWNMVNQSEIGDAYYFNLSTHFGYYIYAAPLVCAFAASGSFVNDFEAGFYRLRLIKCGRKEYQYGLFGGVTIGGGLALAISVLLFAITCSIIFPPYYPATSLVTPNAWLPFISGNSGNWCFMLINALLAYFFGMVWSGVGLTISILSPNRYVSYFAPFIICFCSMLVLPVRFQPLEMLVQLNWTETFSFSNLIVYELVLYMVILIWFRYVFERRIIYGQS